MKFGKYLKRVGAAALAGAMLLGLVPTAFAADGEVNVVADWKFGVEGVRSGTIAAGNLVIADCSGNGNDLRMQTYGSGDWTNYLKFSDDSMTGEGGSMIFDGNTSAKTGADFITVNGAKINSEKFENGYTMEFLYYFPLDWTVADRWMSLIGRQGTSKSISEPEQGTMFASVSNCKEIQFYTANSTDSHRMSSAAWSVSMDEGGVWYHIVIVSDGKKISTYVNGCEAFRDYTSSSMKGMYADPADGRFRVGSSWWNGIDKFLQGSLQEIRICAQPLERKDWLIPDPEKFLGEYGSNREYELKHDNNYTVILLPDTQNTVEFRPDVIGKAIDEVIDKADKFNLAGVIHLGDVVDDNNDDKQYMTARDVFYRLPDAGIKTLIQLGNHDGWTGGIRNYYNSFSGKSTAFKRRSSWYLTSSPNGDGNSSYMFLRAGSYDYLVISLSCTGSSSGGNENTGWNTADEAWLRSVLNEFPNCPTIVTTHDMQNTSATNPAAVTLSSRGWQLRNIVKDYNQVFMLVGGHSHGSGVEMLTNSKGNPVISMLADYQFAYNGGNGFFRYLEFDENDNKLYYSTYSPYAASLDESEKSFFDVNFMTGKGNEGEIELNFEKRFAGLKAKRPVIAADRGRMVGEYHTHTGQSKDATTTYMSLANSLAAAFHNTDVLKSSANSAARFSNIMYGDPFDFIGIADHLRMSYNGVDGKGNGKYDTAFYVAVQTQMNEAEKLQIKGIYPDKLISSGFEWDMPGLDHASVGILDRNGKEAVQGIHEFEWKYGPQGSSDDPTTLFTQPTLNTTYPNSFSDDMDEQAVYGSRLNNGKPENAYAAATWLEQNYPKSYLLPNHPSRHNGQNGEVRIEHLRRLNDAAPNVVFAFEGMPGNHMSGEGRCELPAGDVRNGADEMIAVTGGVWDAMLSEGRRFYNYANSDFHFKLSTDGRYSSGYWPAEYSANHVWVEPNEDGSVNYGNVVDGLRSGNSYSVYGELVSELEFTASAMGASATMGGDIDAVKGNSVTVDISFKTPDRNNYQSFFNSDTGIDVDNIPDLDHVDVIMGHVTGKVAAADYASTANTDAKIICTFSKDELEAVKGEDGKYHLSCTVPADADMYIRIRGTSVAEVDQNGDPCSDEDHLSITNNNLRFDTMNDYNYASLCFYANPIWINVADKAGLIVVDTKGLSKSETGITGKLSVELTNVTAKKGSRVYAAMYGGNELLGVGGADITEDMDNSSMTLVPWDNINVSYNGEVTLKVILVGNDRITPLYPCSTQTL